MFNPITYTELLTLAKEKDWSTAKSIEQAVAKFSYEAGIDLTDAAFVQEEHPLYRFIGNKYQPFHTSIEEVGQYQLTIGNHQSVASNKMEWFENMVKAAPTLFPSLAIVWEGDLILVDGNQRAAARYIAGLRTVWTYTALTPMDKKEETPKVQQRLKREMVIKKVTVNGYLENPNGSEELESLDVEITDPYLLDKIRHELI